MNEEISISFTKDEWRAVSVLIMRHIKSLKLEDVSEQKQELSSKINSYQRALEQLNRDEIGIKNFVEINEKIDKYQR